VDTNYAWERNPVHRVAVRERAKAETENTEHHGSARVQERPRRGAHGEGVPERVDVCGGTCATPTPLGRNVVHSRVRGQGSLPGGASLRVQITAQDTSSRGSGRKRRRLVLRGPLHAPLPGMIGDQVSAGDSMEDG
jgi:hypothetical protein